MTDPLCINWPGVDWNKSNIELACELDIPVYQMRYARSLFAPGRGKVGTLKSRHIDWSAVDWTKPNCVISKELRIETGRVRYYRIKIGKPYYGDVFLYKASQKIPAGAIERADWVNTRDIDLSREWGVTRERVRQIRTFNRFPTCRWHHVRPQSKEAIKWIESNRELIDNKPFATVMSLLPFAGNVLWKRGLLKKSGIKFAPTVGQRLSLTAQHLNKANWDLPNRDLALIWGVKPNQVGRVRFLDGKGVCRWDGRSRMLGRKDQNYQQALLAEIEKAQLNGVLVDAGLFDRMVGRYVDRNQLKVVSG